MPLRCVNFILRVSSVTVSGSIDFSGRKGVGYKPGAGAITAAFMYKIGDPKSTAPFQASWTKDGVAVADDDALQTGTSVIPTAPITERQRMGATSPSDTEPVDPNEVQLGTLTATLPINATLEIIAYILKLVMIQPDE